RHVRPACVPSSAARVSGCHRTDGRDRAASGGGPDDMRPPSARMRTSAARSAPGNPASIDDADGGGTGHGGRMIDPHGDYSAVPRAFRDAVWRYARGTDPADDDMRQLRAVLLTACAPRRIGRPPIGAP